MPMHDWTRVMAGGYHAFHYRWLATIMDCLNSGLLPEGLFALPEQRIEGPIADVLTLARRGQERGAGGSTATLAPTTAVVEQADRMVYSGRSNRLAIHHGLGTVVAVIELVSPGNKDTRHATRAFVRKSAGLIQRGVHLSIIDPFPPGRHDLQGIHRAIWDRVTLDSHHTQPAERPLTVVGYEASEAPTAYLEPFAVGMPIPDLPLFLDVGVHLMVPLEATYCDTWAVLPAALREPLERPTAGG